MVYLNAEEVNAVTEESIDSGCEADLWLGMKVVKGQTYYISIRGSHINDGDMAVSIRPYIYSYEDRELTQGSSKWIISSCVDNTSDWDDDTRSTVYFKVKPNRIGCMKVTLNDFDSNYEVMSDITLTNSKKKALSTSVLYIESDSAFDAYFGVKKGVTYYIKVSDGISITDNSYGIKYSVSKATDRSLAKKSKAKKLKRKAATTYSLFTASTTKSTDWYKFSVTSSRKTIIQFDLNKICSGNLKITIYRGSKKVGTKTYSNTKKDLIINTSSGLKAKPGTYYIKVEKSKKASGTYGIKFVQ